MEEHSLRIDYRLTGPGWSECSIQAGERTVTITASYLGDALGDLARAVLEIAKGAIETKCSFFEEPGEYRWAFSRQASAVSCRIIWLKDAFFDSSELSDDAGDAVFESVIPLSSLVDAARSALGQVLSQYGLAGYRDKWIQHDFPAREYEELSRLH